MGLRPSLIHFPLPPRQAAPKTLKEQSLKKKMRSDTPKTRKPKKSQTTAKPKWR